MGVLEPLSEFELATLVGSELTPRPREGGVGGGVDLSPKSKSPDPNAMSSLSRAPSDRGGYGALGLSTPYIASRGGFLP